MPHVTVILPTYNRADCLARSIDSVLNQRYSNVQLLIIDDGSTDNTREVLRELKDIRIQTIHLSENCGQSAARNTGLSQTSTPYVAFQDSDDEWLPEKLEKQVDALENNPNAGVVYGDLLRVPRSGDPHIIRAPDMTRGKLFDQRTSMYASYGIGIQTCLFRTDVIKSLGGLEEKLTSLEDLELLLRLTRRHESIRIPEILVRYYEGDSITGDRAREYKSRRFLLRRYAFDMLLHNPSWVWREYRNIQNKVRLDRD